MIEAATEIMIRILVSLVGILLLLFFAEELFLKLKKRRLARTPKKISEAELPYDDVDKGSKKTVAFRPQHLCQAGWTCRKVRDWPKYPGESKLDRRYAFDFMDEGSTASLERHLANCPECNAFVWNLRINGFKKELLNGVEENPDMDEVEKAQTKNLFRKRIEKIKENLLLNSVMRSIWDKKDERVKNNTPLN